MAGNEGPAMAKNSRKTTLTQLNVDVGRTPAILKPPSFEKDVAVSSSPRVTVAVNPRYIRIIFANEDTD